MPTELDKILLIDDSLTVGAICKAGIQAAGFYCDSEVSGEKGLALLRSALNQGEPYSLLVLDWHMPKMSGEQVLQEILGELSLNELRIVILSDAQDENIWGFVNAHARIELQVKDEMEALPRRLTHFLAYDITEQLTPKVTPKDDKSLLILVVEDSPTVRAKYVHLLREKNYEVIEAEDVATAKKQINDHNPPLIIVDYMLPDGEGTEVIQYVAAQGKQSEIACVMMSARAENIKSSIDSGALDLLYKDDPSENFIKRIDSYALLIKSRLNKSQFDLFVKTTQLVGIGILLEMNQTSVSHEQMVQRFVQLLGLEKQVKAINNKTVLETKLDNGDASVMEFQAAIYPDGHSVVLVHDISELVHEKRQREAAIEQLHETATHDALTGLANRILLYDHIDRLIAESYREEKSFFILFLDLDGFKVINDSLGHDIGDELLIQVAERLSGACRDSDFVCRLGGDEFCVVAPVTEFSENGLILAGKIIEVIGHDFMVDQQSIRIGVSIGVSLYPLDAQDATGLLKKADIAMYRAKENGRNRCQFFTTEMNEHAQQHMQLSSRLNGAHERNEFVLFYQPQIDAFGQVVGVEALLRWQPEQGPSTGPDEFIPILENSGDILPVGNQIIDDACRQLDVWHKAGFTQLGMAINASPRQFADAGFYQKIDDVITELSLDSSKVEIEITEGLFLNHDAKTLQGIQWLRDKGLTVVLDDFGTGFSSLSYLKNFPVDGLKIDKSFVDDILTDESDKTLIEAVLLMSSGFKHSITVGEGVEELGQAQALIDLNCQRLQGYVISKPLSAEDATAFLHQYKDGFPLFEQD